MKNLIFFLSLIILSCSNKHYENICISNVKYFVNDTLFPMHNIKNIGCLEISKEFYKKAGIKISKYYEIIDENQFDIDKDNSLDSLMVISPIGKMPSNRVCSEEQDAKRILIIKTKNVVYLFDNIIWNKWGFGAHNADYIEEPCSNSCAFCLTNYFGQSCFFEYKLCLSFLQNRIMIDSILIRSGCEGKEINKTINDYNKPLYIENYSTKMIDSLMQRYSL